MRLARTLPVFLALIFSTTARAAITLTGDVDADFTNENCLADDGGDGDVGVPAGVAATGWNIERVCFYYDGNGTDDLYVGVTTVNNVIFGDADGDGDPGASSSANVPIDRANLGSGESFVISLDLDGDSRAATFDVDTVDLLLGDSSSGSTATLGAYNVDNSYDPINNPGLGFGGTSQADVDLFSSPSVTIRDLEFVVHSFKDISVNGVNEIINDVELQVFAGSSVDGGVGDDFLPTTETSVTHAIFDFDDDGLEDWDEIDNEGTDPNDTDTDDDEITDGTEVDGENPTNPNDADTDDDTCNDGVEDSNQNGAFEPTLGESDPNIVDTDEDGLDDCAELTCPTPTDPNDPDTDGDGLLDGEEDVDGDCVHDVGDGETLPNDRDTDNGGVEDGDEVDGGFDPNDPSDDADAATQIAAAANQVQGGGFGCSLNPARIADVQAEPSVIGSSRSNVIIGMFVFFVVCAGLLYLTGVKKYKSKHKKNT